MLSCYMRGVMLNLMFLQREILNLPWIDHSGVCSTILFGSANSGQTSIKCRDLTCNVEPLSLKNSKDFIMKLEVKYLFLTSSSVEDFYIYQLPECLWMLAHGIRMRKNPQPREGIFWIFTDFHEFMGVQIPTCTPAQKFHQWRR